MIEFFLHEIILSKILRGHATDREHEDVKLWSCNRPTTKILFDIFRFLLFLFLLNMVKDNPASYYPPQPSITYYFQYDKSAHETPAADQQQHSHVSHIYIPTTTFQPLHSNHYITTTTFQPRIPVLIPLQPSLL